MELKTLTKENADEVARHLAMASQLIDEDPALAHRHALAAARRAGRIAIVRETLAITAYQTGDYALALRELRTYRRISGKNDQLALMVDSERGVGRPDRALELGRSVDRSELSADAQVALAIAMSGARLDLGQTDAALSELQIPQLDRTRAFSYSPDLFDAYATVLEDLGRAPEAAEWFGLAERARDALGQNEEDVIEVDEELIEFDEADDVELEEVEVVELAEPVDVQGDEASGIVLSDESAGTDGVSLGEADVSDDLDGVDTDATDVEGAVPETGSAEADATGRNDGAGNAASDASADDE
ncbi:hypothetical protein [Planctomonas sp. JC2975]|uniref:hypothetical protein n=1 Tax=Planctomonas sp. JC2975 TaxID=2729626 RepID=UPI00197CADE9|nr:hypothetical protein [Planctomonas sp. JC2975]